MNTKKRTALQSAISLLDRASDIVSDVRDQEENSLDNIPENLQESERFENMELTIDDLDDVVTQIDDVKDSIMDVIEN